MRQQRFASGDARSRTASIEDLTMTDDIEKPLQELTTQQRAAIGKTSRNGVSGRLKAALDDMVENGTSWDAAALKANLTVRSMRLALKRPQVLKYLRAERGALLARISPRNLHALQRIRDQDENKAAAVAAARALEGMASDIYGDVQGTGGVRAGYMIDLSDSPPGIVIRIHEPARPQNQGDDAIDVTPNRAADGS
jgi:hypothetical protein